MPGRLRYFMPYPIQSDLHTILGCLGLSHKYGVDYLRRRALIHLSSGHRTTLSALDASYSEVLTLHWASWDVRLEAGAFILIIELARAVDALWILPHAFYMLSNALKELGTNIFHGILYNGVRANLSMEDQQSFMRGYHIQRDSTLKDVLRFFFDPVDVEGCADQTLCLAERLRVFNEFRHVIDMNPCVPLGIWDSDDWERLDDDELCATCLTALKKIHQDARQAFWDKLPDIYGLPAWEELEKMKTAAIGTDLLC